MTPIYNNTVYVSVQHDINRPNEILSSLPLGTRLSAKIGMYHNSSSDTFQRLHERERQVGVHTDYFFQTDECDTPVRDYLCNKFPQKFGQLPGVGSGAGRELITFLVDDLQFMLDSVARHINDTNSGSAKLNSYLAREEQKACLAKTVAFYQDPSNMGREFLWNAKMRFGKTHVAYQLIMAMDAKLILILTGRPTDTKKAWIEAMDHVDFDFDKDNFIDASLQGNVSITIDSNKRQIIFVSLQDFVRITENGFKEKFANFPNLKFDLLIKDEVHLHFDTEKTKSAIAKTQYDHALNLSGTPFLALEEERFAEDAIFTWSYVDEQKARAQEIAGLGRELAEKEGQYYWLCPMNIYTILLSPKVYEYVEQFTEDEGFTFTKLFQVEEKNGKYGFRNELAVKALINSLCHGNVMPFSSQAHNSHQYNSINIKHTLCYVPGVKEANLFAAMLRKHEIFKQYDIIIAAGDNGSEGNDTVALVMSRIADVESGRNKKHIGTITLTCGKLSHGVSIPEWGSVLNFSDMQSAQLYFQLIFRAQTPWSGRDPKHPGGPKHECYVFDFNPNRTLTHLHALAQKTAGTSDIKSVLTEMLNVFNVLCYEGTEFRRMGADELVSKVQEGFGRSTSLTGLQNLLSEMPFEMDDDLLEGLIGIESGSTKKTKETKVSESDLKNGKNKKNCTVGDDDESDDKTNDVDDEPPNDVDETKLLDEQHIALVKSQLRCVPLYFHLTRDKSFDDVVSNLDAEPNQQACKAITGMLARKLKKMLLTLPKEKQQIVNQSITRLRELERQEHEAYCGSIAEF